MSFFSGGDPGITEEIHIDANEAEIRRTAEQIARILRTAMASAFRGIEKELGDILNGALRGQAAQNVTRGLRNIGDEGRRSQQEIEELTEDLHALAQRSEAFKRSLDVQGRDRNLFAVFDTQVRRLLELEEEFKDKRVQLANDPELLEARRAEARNIIRVLQAEQVSVGRIIDEGRSRNVASMQQETTLRNAEIRTQGAFAVAREQRTARARIELFRFTARQALFFERQIAAAFKGTVRIVGNTIDRIGAGLSRTASLFRRSNREINEGLNGALIARESSMDRSFSRQTSLVRSEVSRQSRILERFQVQASTGVAGLTTGRSQVGALLGGGLAIGGGFVLLRKLQEGFRESVNLNESLNKTRQIFGEASAEIINFANNSVEALFVTRSAALEAASNFGIFGRAAGLTGKDLTEFSTRLVTLATDLASFNNTDVGDAVTAISAALRGESEPIRKYGVLLNEATLQQRALELGIIDTKRVLQPFERVLAANAEILAQTTVAQGDAARTADDFANSSRRAKAASVETFAAIASFLVPFATFLTNLAFPTLQGITKFILNDVNPALRILRDGLIGAAVALGGLLAARAAAEALQFLALALRLVLTPLGLFITLAAALGAAVNILAKRSPAMRAAIDRITDALGSAFVTALGFAVQLLDALASTLTDIVLPLLERFARFLVNNLDRAIRLAFGFITDTAIPALQQFAGFIREDLIPPLVDLATVLVDRVQRGLIFVRDTAVDLFRTVQPFIQPALDGFTQLGGAIRDAFSKADFSGIPGALVGVGTGIGQSFRNIGTQIVEILRPQLNRVLEFLKDFFSLRINAADSIKAFILGPLQAAVETIGFFIGNLITDPRLVKALEAIVALAVLTGANFVKGFILGIASNLDELAVMFSGQFRDVVEKAIGGAFSARNIIRAIVLVIGGAAVASALVQTLRRPMNSAGQRVGQGFIGSFAQSLRQNVGRNGFAGAFIGGFEQFAIRETARTTKTLERAQINAADRLQALGVTAGGRGNIAEAFVGTKGLAAAGDDAVKRLKAVTDAFGAPAVAGGILRARVADVFRSIGDVASSTTNLMTGNFRQFGTDAVFAVQGLFRNITKLGSDVVRNFKAIGAGLGQALGSGIISGIGAVFAGQQLGSASSLSGQAIGIAGIAASSLFAGAAFAGTGLGLPIAAGVAGLGLLTAAFTNSKQAAKEAQERVDLYTDALLRNKDAAEQRADISDILVEGFKDLDSQLREILVGGGVNFDVLAADLQAGGGKVDDFFRSFATRLGFSQSTIAGITDTIGTDFGDLGRSLVFTGDPGIGRVSAGTEALRKFSQEALVLGFSVSDIAAAFSFLDKNVDAYNTAQGVAADVTAATNEETDEQNSLLRASRNQMNTYVNSLKARADASAVAAQKERLDAVAIQESHQAALDRSRGIQQAIDELNRQRTSEVQGQIAEVSERLGAAREASDQAREALLQFLQGNYGDAARAAVADLVLSVPNVASTLQESFDLVPTLRSAAQDKALADIGTGAFAALSQAFNKGELVTTDDARRVLQPFFDVIAELQERPIEPVINPDTGEVVVPGGGISREVADLMSGELNKLLEDEQFEVLLDTIRAADDTQAQLQSQLDDLSVELGVMVFFSEDQIKAAFKDITGFDLDLPLGSGLLGQGVTASTVPGQQAAVIVTANPAGGFTQPVQPTAGSGGIVIETINVNGAQSPSATVGELARRLRVAAGTGFLAPSTPGVLF